MAGKVELDCSVKMDQVLVVDTLKLQWLQPTKQIVMRKDIQYMYCVKLCYLLHVLLKDLMDF